MLDRGIANLCCENAFKLGSRLYNLALQLARVNRDLVYSLNFVVLLGAAVSDVSPVVVSVPTVSQ